MLDLLNAVYARMLTADVRRQEGQAMAEYAVILAIVAVGVVATLILFKNAIVGTLTDVIGAL